MKLFNDIYELLKQTYNRATEFNIGLHSAAIAFYAIFSTAPLIIIIIWILSIILGDQLVQAEFRETIGSILGPELEGSVADVVESASQGSSGFWASLIASIALLFGATTLLSQIKQSLNMIWGLRNPKISSIWHFLWNRLVGLLFIGTLSLLFLSGLIFESMLYGLEGFLIPFVGSENIFVIQLGSSLTNIILAFIFFAALFKILPDLEVQWKDIAIGSIVTTILVLLGKSVIDWYLGITVLQPTYKAAGSFVIFLIWIYYNVSVILIGAIFTQVFTSHYGGDVRPYWNAILEEEWY